MAHQLELYIFKRLTHAEGMIIAIKSDERRPINLGSGVPTSIKVVETIHSLI